MQTHHHKSLQEIHKDVPANHYDDGVRNNLFQKIWHSSRFKKVLSQIKETDGAVLDIGCHAGLFTSSLQPKLKSKKIYGIDISPSAIALARKRIPYGKFEVGDAHHLPYRADFFSSVICLEMLEHVDDPKLVLSEIKRVMKKGGYGLILVPSDNRLFKTIWFLWTMYYPVWRHAHVQSFKSSTLEKLLEKLGLKVTNSSSFNLGMLKIVVFQKK